MEPMDYFHEAISMEMAYETEDICFPVFWDFKYRFHSLQRHWELNKIFLSSHVNKLRTIERDLETAEDWAAYEETLSSDADFFPEYLRLSTISFAISLFENLLSELGKDLAKDLGVIVELDSRPLPYINKSILWITRGCGIEIDIDKDMWSSLDAIRELRNRFIHKIDRDIPDAVKKTMSEMVSTTIEEVDNVTDDFVDVSLKKIGILVKRIELAYIAFYENIS